MDTLHDTTDNPPDPQAATPYFIRAKLEEAAARRGLPYELWAA